MPKYVIESSYDVLVNQDQALLENFKEIRSNVVQWSGISKNKEDEYYIPSLDTLDRNNRIVSQQSEFNSSAGSFDAFTVPCQMFEEGSDKMTNKCHPGWDGSDMVTRDGFSYGQTMSENKIHPKNKQLPAKRFGIAGLSVAYKLTGFPSKGP